ncbi:hypothetical protein M422DRAFT_146814, partial [Sphaerobolus stellatus SS14]
RICPGRFLADNSLFIMTASFLQVFEVLPPRDASGRELSVKYTMGSGMLSTVEDFDCIIRPRSETAQALI